MSRSFTESIVEEAALEWLDELGYSVLHGPSMEIGESAAERSDASFRDVILEGRLRSALARLNPGLRSDAIEDAYRKLTRADVRPWINKCTYSTKNKPKPSPSLKPRG